MKEKQIRVTKEHLRAALQEKVNQHLGDKENIIFYRWFVEDPEKPEEMTIRNIVLAKGQPDTEGFLGFDQIGFFFQRPGNDPRKITIYLVPDQPIIETSRVLPLELHLHHDWTLEDAVTYESIMHEVMSGDLEDLPGCNKLDSAARWLLNKIFPVSKQRRATLRELEAALQDLELISAW